MSEKFQKRLIQAMNLRKIKAAELARRAGLSKARISQYTNGIYEAKQDALYKLALALDVDEAWLMGYDVDIKRKHHSEFTVQNGYTYYEIPRYESIAAGFGALANSVPVGTDFLPFRTKREAEETITIAVTGDSMYPKIENGDTIAVHKQPIVDSGDIAAILIDGDEGVVKKFIIEKERVVLHSLNPDYMDRVFEKEEMNRLTIVGKVTKVVKDV